MCVNGRKGVRGRRDKIKEMGGGRERIWAVACGYGFPMKATSRFLLLFCFLYLFTYIRFSMSRVVMGGFELVYFELGLEFFKIRMFKLFQNSDRF